MPISPPQPPWISGPALAAAFRQQRAHTLTYLQQLRGDAWRGPEHPVLNPPLWEWLHINWFTEYWCLRQQPDNTLAPSWLTDADHQFNSALLAHDRRWHAEYPSPAMAQDYDAYVADAAAAAIATGQCSGYLAELAIHHEAMHEENFMRRAQRLRQPFRASPPSTLARDEWLSIPACQLSLGRAADAASRFESNERFGFDNEFGTQPLHVPAFVIGRTPISETQFAEFIACDGYRCRAWWSVVGWQWRQQEDAELPLYWHQDGSHYRIRDFCIERPPAVDQPMRYLNAHEAEAYCAFATHAAGATTPFRLPTAAEWQRAYSLLHVLPMWEWTAELFQPYPDFIPGPYTEYSTTSFGTSRELRGHSPLLHPGLCRADFRNFFAPPRRDVCAGFRLCQTSP